MLEIDKSDLEKCRSITGGSLDILGRIKGNIKFPSRNSCYLLRGRHGKTRVCAKQPLLVLLTSTRRMKQHLISPSLGVKRNQLCYLNHG